MKRNRFMYIFSLILLVLLTTIGCGHRSSKHSSSNQQPSVTTDLIIPESEKHLMPPLPADGVRTGSANAVLVDWVLKGSNFLTTSKTGITVDGDTIKVKTDTDAKTADPQLAWVQYKYDDWDTSISLPASFLAKFTGSAWDKNSFFYVGSSNYSKGIWDYSKANSSAAGQAYNPKYSYLSKSNNHYIVLIFFGTFDLTIESATITPNLQGATPGVISDITATDQISDTNVTIKWSPINGADHYYLERSDSSDGSSPVALFDSATETTFADVAVEANKAYYYAAYATNKFGKGLYSAWVKGSRKPRAGEFPPANPPTNIVVTPDDPSNKIVITCDRVDDASYYEFYRSLWDNDPNSTYLGLATPPVDPKIQVSFEDKLLRRNVTYFYSVKACNGAGKSGFSKSASGILPGKPPIPNTPEPPVASDGLYTDRIEVSWKAPVSGQIELWRSDDDDGLTPDIYLGEYAKEVTTYSDKDGTSSTESKYFFYRIRNFTANNTGLFSTYDRGNTVNVNQPPGEVEDLTADSSTDSTVVLKWHYDMNYYQLVDRWWIYVSTDSTDKYPSFWMNSNFVKDPIETLHPQTVTVKGLTPGHTYYFYVKGENSIGKSKFSNQASKATTGTYVQDLVSTYWAKHLKTFDNLGNYGDVRDYDLSKPVRQYNAVSGSNGHNGGGAIGIDRTLYINTRDGKLIAFGYTSEETTGVKWIFDPRTNAKASLPDTASVVSNASSVLTLNSDNIVYSILSQDPLIDAYLYCVNRDGTLKWEYNLGKTPVSDPDLGGPTSFNGYIVIAVQDPASSKRIVGIDFDGKEIFAWEPKDPDLRVYSPITFDLGDIFAFVVDSSNSKLGSPYPLVVELDKGVEKWTYTSLVKQANRTQLTKSIVPTRFFVNDIGTKYLAEINSDTGAEVGACDLDYMSGKLKSDYKLAAQYVGVINPDTDPLPYLLIIGNPNTASYTDKYITFINIDGALPSVPKKTIPLLFDTSSQIFISNTKVYLPMAAGVPNSLLEFDLYTSETQGTGDLGSVLDGNVFITDNLNNLILWGSDDTVRVFEGK